MAETAPRAGLEVDYPAGGVDFRLSGSWLNASIAEVNGAIQAIEGKTPPDHDRQQEQTGDAKTQGRNVPSIQVGDDRQPRHRAPPRPNGDSGDAEHRPLR